MPYFQEAGQDVTVAKEAHVEVVAALGRVALPSADFDS